MNNSYYKFIDKKVIANNNISKKYVTIYYEKEIDDYIIVERRLLYIPKTKNFDISVKTANKYSFKLIKDTVFGSLYESNIVTRFSSMLDIMNVMNSILKIDNKKINLDKIT